MLLGRGKMGSVIVQERYYKRAAGAESLTSSGWPGVRVFDALYEEDEAGSVDDAMANT
jgi:hypothetical protein